LHIGGQLFIQSIPCTLLSCHRKRPLIDWFSSYILLGLFHHRQSGLREDLMRKNALSEIMSYLNKRADDDNLDGHYRFSKVEFDAHFRVPFFSANTFLHFSHSNFFFSTFIFVGALLFTLRCIQHSNCVGANGRWDIILGWLRFGHHFWSAFLSYLGCIHWWLLFVWVSFWTMMLEEYPDLASVPISRLSLE